MDELKPEDLAPGPIRDALTAPLGSAHASREATLHWKRKCEEAEARESALIAERDALRNENARLREAITEAINTLPGTLAWTKTRLVEVLREIDSHRTEPTGG